jgi:hypothetical protein
MSRLIDQGLEPRHVDSNDATESLDLESDLPRVFEPRQDRSSRAWNETETAAWKELTFAVWWEQRHFLQTSTYLRAKDVL